MTQSCTPCRPVGLGQSGKLFLAIQHMADQLPVLQVLAGMNGDTREGIEARRGTEERVVALGHVDTARIGIEAGEDGVVEGGIPSMSP